MWPFTTRIRADTQKGENEGVLEADPILRASLGGDDITKEKAMQIPAFAACVRKISEIGAMVPIKLYRRDKDGNVTEIEGDRRTALINFDTGDTLNGTQFKRALISDYLTEKGGYAYVNKQGLDYISLHYVEPGEISFLYNDDPIFKDYRIVVRGKQYLPYEFLKILRNSKNGRCGTSIIKENKEPLSVAYNTMCYENQLVKRGGGKRGFLKAKSRLLKDAMDALREAWKKVFVKNEENIVILNSGIDFQEATETSVEMQLNENKETNGKDICKMLGIAPGIIDGTASADERTAFAKDTLKPIFTEMENEFNRILLLESEKGSYFFAADDSSLTEGDLLKRYQAYAIAKKNGFLQIDEIRTKEKMPELGMKMITLGLQDVLYEPETGNMIVPNMGEKGKINDKKGGAGNEGINKS